MKVIISGGGTGGHIFPAIAIANAVKARYSLSEHKGVWRWRKCRQQATS